MQLFSMPYIEGLAPSETANKKIYSEGLENTINNKAEGGGKINIKTEEKYLDNNCKEIIQFYANEKKEIPRRKTIIGERNSLTNQKAKFIDLSDKRVISTVTRAEYRNAAISIEVKSYAAYGIYQASIFDKIEEIQYEGDSLAESIVLHTLTFGMGLLRPIDRQFRLGCKTKLISSKYIDTNNSKFTEEYVLLQVDMAQKIAIEGAGNFDNLQTDEKGMLNLKLDDESLLSLPEHGRVKLKIVCKTCTRDNFFGSSAGFSGYSNFEIDISEDRKLANRKKINNFFNAALTDLAFTRLASFDSLDYKVTERRYKEMLDGKYGYNATVEGFFEYLQDDFDAKKTGRSLRAQRNLKLAAIDEKNKLEKLAKERDEEVRATRQASSSYTIASQKSKAENFIRITPKWNSAVITNTSLTDYGLCANVFIILLLEEVNGSKASESVALMIALKGEALKTARLNFLSKGYTEQTLGDLLKAFSQSKPTTNDAKYCSNVWFSKVYAATK